MSRRGRVLPALEQPALVLVATLVLGGCGSDAPVGSSGGSDQGTGTVRVLAAASLTEAFTALADTFESDHPGTEVALSFDSSATLAEQVAQGAPADVLATADERTMAKVADDGGTRVEPRAFASNRLQLVVPPDNPAAIERFADLEQPGTTFVVCVESAPCGKLAATLLDGAGITAEPASEEVDVKAVLSRVALDEADAGLVYATDAVAAGDAVRAIDVPASADSPTRYPIAALADADEPALAEDWVRLVLSRRGQQVLADAGFGKP